MIALKKIRIATRDSQLALWQTNHVISLITKKYPELEFEIIPLKAQADKILDISLNTLGQKEGKGLFTKELDTALLNNTADIAIHSLKDIPTELDSNLSIISVLNRHDYQDAFISHPNLKYNSLDALPQNAIIATGSLRRRSQLLKYRSDLQIVPLRGNVNTRLKKLDDSQWSGIILASAGIERLNYSEKISFKIPSNIMLPAAGQGSIAIMAHNSNKDVKLIVSTLEDLSADIMALAERSFLKETNGGCSVPVGVLCQHDFIEEKIKIDAFIGSLDGKNYIRESIEGEESNAINLGKTLAIKMLDLGGRKILEEVRNSTI